MMDISNEYQNCHYNIGASLKKKGNKEKRRRTFVGMDTALPTRMGSCTTRPMITAYITADNNNLFTCLDAGCCNIYRLL